MKNRLRSMLAAMAGAALLGACSDGDALTSPIGTTVASVRPAVQGARFLVVFENAPPAGFVARVADLGGEIQWVDRRGAAVVVGGLSDDAAVMLLRMGGVAGVRRVAE